MNFKNEKPEKSLFFWLDGEFFGKNRKMYSEFPMIGLPASKYGKTVKSLRTGFRRGNRESVCR
jgi:hypothetical protein